MRILAFAFLCLATAGHADERKTFSELYPPMPGVDYFCTDAHGARYELGQTICITASCQTWMATCTMSLNNPNWRKISEGCPVAGLLDRLRALG